ncbi:MAG: DUF5696 domain-containing protein, partial [Oscillospiraceae bacterium]|nr:DUF5696 domain-containing protein [Oscillospiraceae bacterium]
LTDNFLRSVEFGANIHFTLSKKETSVLKEAEWSQYANYFSIDFDTWKSDVLDNYKKYNDLHADLQNQLIQDHIRLPGNVAVTTYEDGTAVLVNYNRVEYTVKGVNGDVIVPPKSFVTAPSGFALPPPEVKPDKPADEEPSETETETETETEPENQPDPGEDGS